MPAIAPAATNTARLHAVGRKAERLGAQVVVADGDARRGRSASARRRAGRRASPRARRGRRSRRCVRVLQVEAEAEQRAGADVEALVAAVALDRVGQVEQHLPEGERDHDEVDAAGAQRDRADHERREGGERHGREQVRAAVEHALAHQHAGGVGAEADEGGVAERDHAAVAEHEVEAGRGDREDDDLAGGADVVVGAERVHRGGTAGRPRAAARSRRARPLRSARRRAAAS